MASTLLKRNMRLFGLPYQFLPEVDPRIPTVSTTVGRKFAENIILDAPVISIIPGKPKYLPSAKNKQTTTKALISAASDNLGPLKQLSSEEFIRYYDFERSYTEYIKYVNILCRTCASFLEITELIDGETCQRYDYRNYKWNTDSANGSTALEKSVNSLMSKLESWGIALATQAKNAYAKITHSDTTINTQKQSNEMLYTTSDSSGLDSVSNFLENYNYVQFFVDADVSANESLSNSTSESKFKGLLDSGTEMVKELAFLVNSGGLDAAAITEFASSAVDAVGSLGEIFDANGKIAGALSRIFDLSANVIKGENVIMPEVYQSSSYDKQYTFTVHLKTPYGTKFGYFMDICVPLMHLIALALPRQSDNANSYASPFLVKAYCEGLFTCNLGIVDSIQISKGINGSFSVDGLPTEVDVSVSIKDLYSDMSMSPQSSPLLFVNNSSLVEYLATTCGLSLITPNLERRLDMIVNAVTNAFTDIDNNIISGITEAIDKSVMDFLGLSAW